MGLNSITFTVVLAFYTLFILGLVLYYENQTNNYIAAISDYKRALKYSHGSAHYQHYTNLQLEVKSLDQDNKTLQLQVNNLKAENAALRNGIKAGESGEIQYEHSIYKGNTYANYTELEEEKAFVRKYGYSPKYDK